MVDHIWEFKKQNTLVGGTMNLPAYKDNFIFNTKIFKTVEVAGTF